MLRAFLFSLEINRSFYNAGPIKLSFVEAANLRRSMFWFALASYDRMVSLIQIKTKTN